jgi:site-specific recombinase XerD
MLMMLATYGLRAGEVIRLRLDDIDWREERFRIRRSKTGVESFLPLMAAAGEALLDYLEHGRPQASVREVFLRVRAPYGPFLAAGSLDKVIDCRLKQAGIEVKGRHGSHAFRFARAQSLLRASVPLKSIGDVLGHRRIASTETYLRLATDDLRAISLECPAKECDACLAG